LIGPIFGSGALISAFAFGGLAMRTNAAAYIFGVRAGIAAASDIASLADCGTCGLFWMKFSPQHPQGMTIPDESREGYRQGVPSHGDCCNGGVSAFASPGTHRCDGRRQRSRFHRLPLHVGVVGSGQYAGYSGFETPPFIVVEPQVRECAIDVLPECRETGRIDELTPANCGEAADDSLPRPAANVLRLEQGSVQDSLVRRAVDAAAADRLALPPDKHEGSQFDVSEAILPSSDVPGAHRWRGGSGVQDRPMAARRGAASAQVATGIIEALPMLAFPISSDTPSGVAQAECRATVGGRAVVTDGAARAAPP
jgi:hypothetical protein